MELTTEIEWCCSRPCGDFFSLFLEHKGSIKKIGLWWTNVIKRISVTWQLASGKLVSEVIGGEDPSASFKEILLAENEYITRIEGKHFWLINQITLFTSRYNPITQKGKHGPFGNPKNQGKKFLFRVPTKITGFFGKALDLIDSLGVYFEHEFNVNDINQPSDSAFSLTFLELKTNVIKKVNKMLQLAVVTLLERRPESKREHKKKTHV
eukprot:TRINITY_DN3127_c0_g2_i4.p2 TRINITY_DN3127_c0_g2~~TRINITY_DN3127_c0_g2_i4.p2  ORF type:complete len:209 (-),score=41.81 TRINITY_DN3127_c0_g2_i4:50-676(-)